MSSSAGRESVAAASAQSKGADQVRVGQVAGGDHANHHSSSISVARRAVGNRVLGQFLQAKLTVGPANDPFEQEADRVADALASVPVGAGSGAGDDTGNSAGDHAAPVAGSEQSAPLRRSGSGPSGSGPAPGAGQPIQPELARGVESMRGGGGAAMAPEVRAHFEAHLGADFSGVRIHTDAGAANIARSLNARAFAVGNDVAFSAGAYAPGTRDGRALIAHELTHVLQQGGGAAGVVQRADDPPGAAAPPTTAPALWYQKVLDDQAEDQGRAVQFYPEYLTTLRALCEAVDAGRKDEIPNRTDAWLKRTMPGMLAIEYTGTAVADELYTRMILLGLHESANKIREYSYVHNIITPITGPPVHNVDMGLFSKAEKRLTADLDLHDAASARTSIERVLALYADVQGALRALDPALVELEMDLQAKEIGTGSGLGWRLSFDDMSALDFYTGARALLMKMAATLWRCFQVMEDAAIDEMGGNSGTAALAAARAMLTRIGTQVYQTDLESAAMTKQDFMANIGNETADVTTTDFAKKKHNDAFGSGASVRFTFYSSDPARQPHREGKAVGWDLYRYHDLQLALLERLGGNTPNAALKAEAGREQAVIAGMGGLRIHNNDDLRAFVSGKYDAERGAGRSDAEAFQSVMNFIGLYYGAFTFHTPYNIEEFGDNYLNKTFPRALTGQLIHDCGVYALRTIYILSLLRASHPELNLSIRYIRMPVHIGLIITGTGLPIYFAHNDEINALEPSEIVDGATTAADVPQNTLADVATGFFIPKTSMPYRMGNVPLATGGNTATLRDKYYRFYTETTTPDVIGADAAVPDFQLQYLALMDKHKELYNTQVVPFWNLTARGLWQASGAALVVAFDAFNTAAPGQKDQTRAAYIALRDAYVLALETAFGEKLGTNTWETGLRLGLSGMKKDRAAISTTLDDHKKLIAPGAKRAHAENANIDYNWLIEYSNYVRLLKDDSKIDTLTAPDLVPPWASKDLVTMK